MVKIRVAIEHRYFRQPLEVWIEWDFPFLPRAGEVVNPWLWIEPNTFEVDSLKEDLTSEGLKDLNDWNSDLPSWLYEMGIEADKVSGVSYFRKEKNNEMYVILFFREE